MYVYGVPKINLKQEVETMFKKYGNIKRTHVVSNVETEAFTECYHVHYERIQSARIAKRMVDNKNFYGGVLHVCYVPEHETVAETRKKLQQRNKDVLSRLGKMENYTNLDKSTEEIVPNRSRKRLKLE